ncbi:hypothetical protein NDU88_004693 [Pleurodeles waltl]|uniref:Uncharacterized protein n=1 Tax=Pleurodeles waltl TaxID=8319 RepID=A0AAV7MU74_PLEWA|nr:hypothetical protein NDU88_004693 [Pleurodeles waltl]
MWLEALNEVVTKLDNPCSAALICLLALTASTSPAVSQLPIYCNIVSSREEAAMRTPLAGNIVDSLPADSMLPSVFSALDADTHAQALVKESGLEDAWVVQESHHCAALTITEMTLFDVALRHSLMVSTDDNLLHLDEGELGPSNNNNNNHVTDDCITKPSCSVPLIQSSHSAAIKKFPDLRASRDKVRA